MAGGYEFGQVVLADIPDPGGEACDHEHPAMVFRGPDSSGKLYLIAISTKFERPVGRLMIEVPWQAGGHPVTGLSRPSVLKCGWTVEFNASLIRRRIGSIPADIAEKAVEYVLTAIEEKRQRQAKQA